MELAQILIVIYWTEGQDTVGHSASVGFRHGAEGSERLCSRFMDRYI